MFIMMLKNYIATTTGTTVCWSLISHDIIIPLGIFLISSYLYAVCTKNRCTFTTVCLGYPVYVYVCGGMCVHILMYKILYPVLNYFLLFLKKKGSLTQYPPYHRSLSVQRNAKHWVECQQALQNDP